VKKNVQKVGGQMHKLESVKLVTIPVYPVLVHPTKNVPDVTHHTIYTSITPMVP